ncbi:MAG: hypothetical protein LBJ67_13280 [Planctomycetaceae bacterium]|jgi:hypothetical protein|nr:hypothetical protein [Planctomycetaceae bacterium]
MKMKHWILTLSVICLVLPSFNLWGQDTQDVQRMLQQRQSPRWLLWNESQERPTYRALWEGRGDSIAARVLLRIGGKDTLNLSEEQLQQMPFLTKENEVAQELLQQKFQENDPEFMQDYESLQKAQQLPENLTEEQQQAYVTETSKFFQWADRLMDQRLYETLTPEQLQTVQIARFQLLPELGFPVSAVFEPLGLSEQQKELMEASQKELEPEFDALVDEMMELRKEQLKGMVDNLKEMLDGKEPTREEFHQIQSQAAKKATNNETLRERYKATSERGKKFATQLRTRMMNLLTDEQLDKMQVLLDDMPDYVKTFLDGEREERNIREKSGQWTFGPDSWRPGDGVPEELKKERKRRNPNSRPVPGSLPE